MVAPQETSALIYLREILDWDGESQGIDKALAAAFEAKDYLHCVKNLQATNIEPLSYINRLDQVSLHLTGMQRFYFIKIRWQVIDTLPTDSSLWKQCIRSLTGACASYGILPVSHEITFPLTEPHGQPISSCHFFNLWKLTHKVDHNQVFAVKSFYAYSGYNPEIRKV